MNPKSWGKAFPGHKASKRLSGFKRIYKYSERRKHRFPRVNSLR
jgi:hypothetical protein